MHDSAQVMEGGLAIEIKGSLRLRFRYEVVDDLDEDVGNVALMQGICKSQQSVALNALHLVLESEIDMIQSCGPEVTSAHTEFPHECACALVTAGRALCNMQECLDLLMRVRELYLKEEQVAARAVDKVREAAILTQRAAEKKIKERTGSAAAAAQATLPSHVQKRIRDEESACLDALKAKSQKVRSLTKMMRESMDVMALVLRACLKIGHVVSNGAEVVGANVTEVLVSDRQATPIVSSRALARQALESFGKSCAYVEQHYARATGVSAAFDWQN